MKWYTSLNVKHPVYPSRTYITKQSGLSFVFYEDMHVNMAYIVGKEIVSSVVNLAKIAFY